VVAQVDGRTYLLREIYGIERKPNSGEPEAAAAAAADSGDEAEEEDSDDTECVVSNAPRLSSSCLPSIHHAAPRPASRAW
jgi:hypothetical protein